MITSKAWTQTVWPFDSEYAKKVSGKVWAKKFGRGIVYLVDNENFDYVSSFGANSDDSYSGCFYGMGVKDVDTAKKLLDYKIPAELGGESYNVTKRHMTHMLGHTVKEISNDASHDQALEKTGFWGNQGAGALVLAKTTNKLLIPFRSLMVLQPHTWGVWGGAIDQGEKPKDAVMREMHEEVGFKGTDIHLIPLYVFEDQKSGFKYHNFLAIVPDEFRPELNWETDNYKWVEFGDWPSPLHFGLKALLQHSGKDIEKIIKMNKNSEPLGENSTA